MEKEKEKVNVNKLLSVKFIIAVLLTLVFCYLSITGKPTQEFVPIYTMVVGFYFGQSVGSKSKM